MNFDAVVTYCQKLHTPLQLLQYQDLVLKSRVVDYMGMIQLIGTLLLVAVIVAVDHKVDSFVEAVYVDIGWCKEITPHLYCCHSLMVFCPCLDHQGYHLDVVDEDLQMARMMDVCYYTYTIEAH